MKALRIRVGHFLPLAVQGSAFEALRRSRDVTGLAGADMPQSRLRCFHVALCFSPEQEHGEREPSLSRVAGGAGRREVTNVIGAARDNGNDVIHDIRWTPAIRARITRKEHLGIGRHAALLAGMLRSIRCKQRSSLVPRSTRKRKASVTLAAIGQLNTGMAHPSHRDRNGALCRAQVLRDLSLGVALLPQLGDTHLTVRDTHADQDTASGRWPQGLSARRFFLIPAALVVLALSGCAPRQESESVSKAGNQFLEEEKREAPKLERVTREAEASLRELKEEEGG